VTVDRSLPERLSRYSFSLATLLSLVAGRASYRLIQAATTVLLLPVWGSEVYGTFAAAMASFAWLMALVFTGPEKLVLKLLPRSPRTGPMVTGGLLAMVWWLPLPPVVAFGLVYAGYGAGAPTVYVGVAAMQLSIGCTLLLIGLHRAYGRPRPDVATFATMSAVQVTLLAAAAAGRIGPVGFVAGVIGTQLAMNALLAASLGRPTLLLRRRPRFLGRLAWSALLLGGTDLYLYLSTAVLFTFLAASSWSDQVGPLYVAVIVWSAGVNLLIYVLRIFAPRTSLLLAGRSGPAGRRDAARLAGRTAAVNAAWLVLVVAAIAVLAAIGEAAVFGAVALWVVLLVSRAPAVAGILWAAYRLENTDATAPRVAALAAVVGLATVTVVGLVAVPVLGAVGVVIAYGAGELGFVATLAARGAGRDPRGGPRGEGEERRVATPPDGTDRPLPV
jgi:hypothetical protein